MYDSTPSFALSAIHPRYGLARSTAIVQAAGAAVELYHGATRAGEAPPRRSDVHLADGREAMVEGREKAFRARFEGGGKEDIPDDAWILVPKVQPALERASIDGYLPLPQPITLSDERRGVRLGLECAWGCARTPTLIPSGALCFAPSPDVPILQKLAGAFLYAQSSAWEAPIVDMVLESHRTGSVPLASWMLDQDPLRKTITGQTLASNKMVEWSPFEANLNYKAKLETMGLLEGTLRAPAVALQMLGALARAAVTGGSVSEEARGAVEHAKKIGREITNSAGWGETVQLAIRRDYTIYWEDLKPESVLPAMEKLWLSSPVMKALRDPLFGVRAAPSPLHDSLQPESV